MRDSVFTLKLHTIKNALLVVFVACYFSINYFEGGYRYPWLVIRVLWYAIALVYIWNQRKVRLWAGFIPTAVIILFSLITMTYNFAHLSNSLEMLKEVGIIVLDVWLILASTRDKKDLDGVWIGLFVGGVLATIYQFTQMDFSALEDGASTAIRYSISEDLFVNSYAFHLYTSFIAGYFLLLKESERSNRLWIKILVIFCMAAIAVASFFTGSRKILLAVPIFLFVAIGYGKKNFWKLLLIGLLVYAVFMIIMEVPTFYNVIGWRIESLFVGEEDASVAERGQIMQDAFETGLFHPWGVGLDNSKFYSTGREVYAHNNYLEFFADFGWVGVVCYYLYYGNAAVKLLRRNSNQKYGKRSFYLAILVTFIILEMYQVVYYNFAYHLAIALIGIAIHSNDVNEMRSGRCVENGETTG